MANLRYFHNLLIAQWAIQRGGVEEGWCTLCCQSAIQHVLQAEHTQAVQKFTQVSIYWYKVSYQILFSFHAMTNMFLPHSLIPTQLNPVRTLSDQWKVEAYMKMEQLVRW